MDKLLTYEKKIKFFLKRRNTVVILNYLFIIKCKGAQKARVSTTKSINSTEDKNNKRIQNLFLNSKGLVFEVLVSLSSLFNLFSASSSNLPDLPDET